MYLYVRILSMLLQGIMLRTYCTYSMYTCKYVHMYERTLYAQMNPTVYTDCEECHASVPPAIHAGCFMYLCMDTALHPAPLCVGMGL